MVPDIDSDFHPQKIEPDYRDLFDEALPFLETRNNILHTYIVYQYALALLKKEDANSRIVLPASILHDVGWSAIPEKEQLQAFGPNISKEELRRKHETEGVLIARKILTAQKFKEDHIKTITDIIDGHDTRTVANTPEDALVKDADKLWRYSKTGFNVDARRFGIEPKVWLNSLSESIDDWFLTREGKQLATLEYNARKQEGGF